VWLVTVRCAPDSDRHGNIGDRQLSAKTGPSAVTVWWS